MLPDIGRTAFLEWEREEDRCDAIVQRIVTEDRATVTDDAPSRLHSIWLSQQCETRAGPEHVIRKYGFFENSTFLLLRFHYAEESCSIATYGIVARGSIEISSPSIKVPGATEANVRLDSVHLIPFTRQVAHKFGRRINTNCGGGDGGMETKWRPYRAQLIYERPVDISSSPSLDSRGLNSNSFESRLRRPKNRDTFSCLEFLGVEFTELKLFRVEKRRIGISSVSGSSNRDSVDRNQLGMRIELLLGGSPRNGRFFKFPTQTPSRLQPVTLLRADTVSDCPICGNVLRATEYNPPLLHQAPTLPALIGGLWLSQRCESVDEGFWTRRVFRIYSAEGRWAARWTYYADSTCSILLYTVTAAGTYLQRALRRKRQILSARNDVEPSLYSNLAAHDAFARDINLGVGEPLERSDSNLYPVRMSRSFGGSETGLPIAASTVRQGRRRSRPKTGYFESANRIVHFSGKNVAPLPSGTIELKLQVMESRSIPTDRLIELLARCDATRETFTDSGNATESITDDAISITLSKNCIPQTVEAPAILMFKARVNLDWNGDYALLLASWKDDVWEAPLLRCSDNESKTKNWSKMGNSPVCM
ncbi:PREDICTED: protein APCDD1-like [Dufourea novaeangliae]|uniref:protein APCDD1-like n=1 Tax=Dufourea novaeangliae TaxID=178035 RepID=UPI0007672D40|nr:PREDICTED: protein APCDD1-like [Dufourea novaeangliae]